MHCNMNVQPVIVFALEFQRCASQRYGVVQCLMDQMGNYYGIWWLPYECFVLYVSLNLFSTRLHLRLAVVPVTMVRQAVVPVTMVRQAVVPVTVVRQAVVPVTVVRQAVVPVTVVRQAVLPVTVVRQAVLPVTVVRQANDDSKVQHPLRSLEPWQQVSNKKTI